MIENLEDQDRRVAREKEFDDSLHRGFRPGSDQCLDAADDAKKLDVATERLRQIEGLRDEKWQDLDASGRMTTLNAAGRELGEVYDHPTPPVLAKDMGDPNLLGTYGDGYRYNARSGSLEGSDYGIRMNSVGEVRDQDLLGDDPRVALQTYAHEFRHSYQHEQAGRWEKPQFQNLVDNQDAARRWSENLNDYQSPDQGYDAYHSQAVEADARRFAEDLVKRVYS